MKKLVQGKAHPMIGMEEKEAMRKEAQELRVLKGMEKVIVFLLLFWIFLISFSNKKVRAADSSVIESVEVVFTSQFGGQEEIVPPEVRVQTNYVELADTHYRKSYDQWVPGQKVRV